MNPQIIKQKIFSEIGEFLGTAKSGTITQPSIFIGDPKYSSWSFSGILCVISAIENNSPVKITGGFFEPQDWKVTLVNYQVDGSDPKAMKNVWDILKYKFPRIKHIYFEADSRGGTMERLIINIPNDYFSYTLPSY